LSETVKKLFELEKSGTNGRLILHESLTIVNGNEYDRQADYPNLFDGIKKLTLDFTRIGSYDSYAVLFLRSLLSAAANKGVQVIYEGMTDDMHSFIDILSREVALPEKVSKKTNRITGLITDVGTGSLRSLGDAYKLIEFVGELIIKMLLLFINPFRMRWKDFPYQFFRSGVAALPICLLILLLIGLVTGYTGAVQLHQFGGDMYIADLVGISITRELGPLMTAIIIAGRSGSSFAAEIGTMKVSEEVDALNSMGFDYMRFLVMPRVMSVVIAMPMLTLLADLAGIAGGLISGLAVLNITLTGYINGLQGALTYYDVIGGLVKSMVFGFLIATVGCFRGMQVSGGAESVGKFTTASVVSAIFLIIIADSVFTFIFSALGI